MGLFYCMAESKNQGHSSAKDTLASDAIGPSRMYKKILAWAETRGLHLAAVEAELRDGFGAAMGAEDRFDSLVGLLGMVAVVLGELPEGPPQQKPIEQGVNLGVEGWILGHPWEPA
jgi:hypothetical protein